MSVQRNRPSAGPGAGSGERKDAPSETESALPLEEIRRAVESIRYGTVQIVVQDGRVVQIDKTEKIRLT